MSEEQDKRIDINDGIAWRDAEGRDWVPVDRFRAKIARIEELEAQIRVLQRAALAAFREVDQ